MRVKCDGNLSVRFSTEGQIVGVEDQVFDLYKGIMDKRTEGDSIICDFNVSFDGEYDRAKVTELLDRLLPLLVSADIRYYGGRNSVWRFFYSPGMDGYIEENADTVFPSNLDGASDELLQTVADFVCANFNIQPDES